VRNARHLQSHVDKLSLRTIIIRSAIVVVVALIAWLLGARQLSLMLDRLVTVPLYALPVSPIAYSPDTLWIDKLSFNFTPAAQPIEVHVVCDAANRVTLTSGGQPFPMGICTRSPQYASEFDFTADAGDKVSSGRQPRPHQLADSVRDEFHDRLYGLPAASSVLPADLGEGLGREADNAMALRTRLPSRRWMD
jgi:hypothetical protein